MISITLPQVPSGNSVLLATVVVADAAAAAVNSITQTGATWVRALASSYGEYGERVEIWYALNPSGADTSIVIDTDADLGEAAIVQERTRISQFDSEVVDQTSENTDADSETITTGAAPTTTRDLEFLLAALGPTNIGEVSSPTNGFDIDYQHQVGTVTIAALSKAALATEAPEASATLAYETSYAAALATFFVSNLIPITSVSVNAVGQDGGYVFDLTGDFTELVGSDLNVHLGLTGSDSDSKCYSGRPGRATTIRLLNSSLIRCYTPRLDTGDQTITVKTTNEEWRGVLPDAIESFPRGYETAVYDMRRLLPPKWRKGPVRIDEES